MAFIPNLSTLPGTLGNAKAFTLYDGTAPLISMADDMIPGDVS
jgi:hypothetical protein